MIPADYRKSLRRKGIDDAGGRAVPDWTPESSLEAMARLDVATAILSVSAPGTTFLPNPADAAALARDLNDHSADLAASQSDRLGFFAVDFLLDTSRAAYLLVRNGIRHEYPNIKFILSHAGGFVPYASYRMAMGIAGDIGRSPAHSVDDFSSFYFDTALSSSAAAMPTLLAFAKPGHVTFGSDFPFAPVEVSEFFVAGLDTYDMDADTRTAINATNALALFPRLAR